MIQSNSRLRPQLMMVWRWFFDLCEIRSYKKLTVPEQTTSFVNGAMQRGIGWRTQVEQERLTPLQLQSWSALAGVALEVWHVAALTMMDAIFVNAANNPPTPAIAATKDNLIGFFKMLGMKTPK